MSPKKGFALIAVLWGLVILGMISSAMIAGSGVMQRQAFGSADTLRWSAIEDALVNEAVLELLGERTDHPLPTDGTWRAIASKEVSGEISIQDESGRIDLNVAPRDVLVDLLRSTRLDPERAMVLADRIVEWRKPADDPSIRASEAATYDAAGLGYAPRGGPFQRVDEARLVLGMTSATYDRIAPALTVFSGNEQLDPDLAPPAALASFPGIDAERASQIVAARGKGISFAAFVGRSNGDATATAPKSAGRVGRAFEIVLRLHMPDDRQIERRETIRLVNLPASVFWVLDRRDSPAEGEIASRQQR